MSAEKKPSIWGRMLKALALDESTTPEDLEEAAKLGPKEEIHDEAPAAPVKPTVPSPEGKAPAAEAHDEEPTLASIAATLSGICTRLDKLEAGKAPAQDEDKDALQEIIGEEQEETPAEQAAEEESGKEGADNYDAQEDEESQTIPPEDVPEQHPTADAKAVKKLAADVRSVLAKNITDPKKFKKAAKDAASAITAAYGPQNRDNSGYAQFIKTTGQAAKARLAHDGVSPVQRVYAETQSAYDQINPHTHKEVK